VSVDTARTLHDGVIEHLEETMTTILLAGMLGFLIILTVALTLMRAAIKRNSFPSDG
jgi:hypothetical protein